MGRLELACCDLRPLAGDEPLGVVGERKLPGLLGIGQGGCAAYVVLGVVEFVLARFGLLAGGVGLLPGTLLAGGQTVGVCGGFAPHDFIPLYWLALPLAVVTCDLM